MKRLETKRAFSLLEVSIVIVIIGVLIVGVIGSKHLISKSRLITAKAMTRSSPISGTLNNKLWLESSFAELSLGENLKTGDAITSWLDSANNQNPITVLAVGNGATYANTINHVQAVKFGENSADDHLQIDDVSFLNNTDYSIFITEKRISTNSGDGNYLLGSAGSFAVGYESGSSIIQTHGESADDDNQANIEGLSSYSNKPRVIVFTHSSVDGNKIYINGTLANEDSTSTAKTHLTGLTTLAIGNNYNGEIGEIVIFDRELKVVERREIEDYMTEKWDSPNNRYSSADCVTGIITSTGCDTTCYAPSVNGITSSSTIVSGGSASYSCNATGYTGSTPTYSCLVGVLSPTPSSSDCVSNNGCASGYLESSGSCVQGCSVATISGTSDSGDVVADGATVTCDETGYDGSTIATCSAGNSITGSCDCGSGYNSDGGTCKAQCTLTSGSSGLPLDVTVNSGSSSYSCSNVSGYSGTVSYTCNNGIISSISGTCAEASSSCTGGDSTDTETIEGETLHIFTSVGSANFECAGSVSARVLIVGGGGGGSADVGGGGGGGQVVDQSVTLSGTVSVTVGAGGLRGYNRVGNSTGSGNTGGTSSITYSGTTISALGGSGARGRSGGWNNALAGSGYTGGGAAYPDATSVGSTGTGGASYKGGNSSSSYGGGGGGGAGGVGQSRPAGGNGGIGLASDITGTSTYYGGGGGGSGYSSGAAGIGGLGGGGNGTNNTTNGYAGQNGLGGGGGGAGSNASPTGGGGNGGSGIVIIRY